MVQTENLRTATLYINNQLLSRGLLSDGQSIDFAEPGQDEEELGETMGRIICVVNVLILRRDVRCSFLIRFHTHTHTHTPSSGGSKANDGSTYSAAPNPASHSRPHCGPSGPNRCGRPATSSGCRRGAPARGAGGAAAARPGRRAARGAR